MVVTAFLMAACSSSKSTSTVVNDDALSVLKPKVNTTTATQNTASKTKTMDKPKAMVDKAKKKTGKVKDKVMEKPAEMTTEAVESVEAMKEEVDIKKMDDVKEKVTKEVSKDMEEKMDDTIEAKAKEVMEKEVGETEVKATELSTLETETLEIDEEKIIDEEVGEEANTIGENGVEERALPVESNTQQSEMNIIGKYKWVKRVCCGRMRVETTPQDGEELIMEITEDGKILYSGNSQKKAEDTTYTMDVNSKTFPDRPMLKIEGKIDALIKFNGDTLIIDRGYIDLDKNYWTKIKE